MTANLFTVYSPEGEPFETSWANARDLTSHAGWTHLPPANIAAVTVPPVKEEPKVEAPVETKDEADDSTSSEGSSEARDEADEGQADESEADEASEDEDAASAVTVETFADLADRDSVVAYLADKFPDFKPHHKQGRDKLVEKLVELTNA